MKYMKKILIAEDSNVVKKLTQQVLEKQDYYVKGVKNGQEVLEAMEQEQYHIILLDINMPVMNGLVCTEEIRKREKVAEDNVWIIAITGNALDYTKDMYQSYGIDDMFEKPLNYDLLIATLKSHDCS